MSGTEGYVEPLACASPNLLPDPVDRLSMLARLLVETLRGPSDNWTRESATLALVVATRCAEYRQRPHSNEQLFDHEEDTPTLTVRTRPPAQRG